MVYICLLVVFVLFECVCSCFVCFVVFALYVLFVLCCLVVLLVLFILCVWRVVVCLVRVTYLLCLRYLFCFGLCAFVCVVYLVL